MANNNTLLKNQMRQCLDRIIASETDNGVKVKLTADLDYFDELYNRFLNSESKVAWDEIEDVPAELFYDYEQVLDGYSLTTEEESELLKRVVVIKLNGGLGTSMGCGREPKSLVEVRDGQTFLDITLRQIQHVNECHPGASVPLLLVESFGTRAATRGALEAAGFAHSGGDEEDGCWRHTDSGTRVLMVEQSRCPRIDARTLMPYIDGEDAADECWYPPGHGNVPFALRQSGALGRLLAAGRRHALVSNADNLCATLDCGIVKLVSDSGAPYMMEVTRRTEIDSKCGTLIQYRGRIVHLETPMVPAERLAEFQSVERFKSLNTNSIWLDLAAVERVLAGGGIHTDVLVNPKTLASGRRVLQLETAIGGAIQAFAGARCITVPRGRFAPVKRADALVLVASDAYELDGRTGALALAPGVVQAPALRLDTRYYSTVADVRLRFAHGPPSMRRLASLTIVGDVRFGAGVILEGAVSIRVADDRDRVEHIPDGSILCNVTIDK